MKFSGKIHNGAEFIPECQLCKKQIEHHETFYTSDHLTAHLGCIIQCLVERTGMQADVWLIYLYKLLLATTIHLLELLCKVRFWPHYFLILEMK